MVFDIVLAIAASLALVVSAISVIITAKSIRNQEIHNKNSLRPICSIYQTNYDNFFSVRIQNDGIGTLIIDNIKCIRMDTNEESETLYNWVLNVIKQREFHRILTGKSAPYSICPNGKIYIIAMTPEDNETKENLRELLKKIKIIIKYSDIYDTKQVCEKELSLFRFVPPGTTISNIANIL